MREKGILAMGDEITPRDLKRGSETENEGNWDADSWF